MANCWQKIDLIEVHERFKNWREIKNRHVYSIDKRAIRNIMKVYSEIQNLVP